MMKKVCDNQCLFFLKVLGFGENKNIFFLSNLSSWLGKGLIKKIEKKNYLISSLLTCIPYKKITFPRGMTEDIAIYRNNVFLCSVNSKLMYCCL